MRVKLGVNVDHVATIRQARGTRYPDPVAAAMAAENAGADQITVHLREDRRHIQERDLTVLRETVQTHLNLEMAANEAMQAIALTVKPDVVTLVPEKRQELTTESGLNVIAMRNELRGVVVQLRRVGITVSIFVDPVGEQIDACREVGADSVELHTGTYCDARRSVERARELQRLREAAKRAKAHGMYVAAGHGLDYRNVADVVEINEIEELNIGHSIVARAFFVGFEQAVREMLAMLER
ncbi:MAG: pyridoxine 5'-phosphate synthase [Myxococcales bacterium]|nr:pyridoxine 5'-phosphate synthase [Myxococcales bacterium]